MAFHLFGSSIDAERKNIKAKFFALFRKKTNDMHYSPRTIFAALLLSLLLPACNLFRQAQADETFEEKTELEYRQLDTLSIVAKIPAEQSEKEAYSLPPYNPSATRESDLLHTSLDLSFDWEKQAVIGTARLKVRPYFYPTDQLKLDAKGFEIKSVSLLPEGQSLSYEYEGQKLVIQLDKTYTREQSYEVEIDYVAYPRAEGGSSAISSDKGLYFINPEGKPDKPRQIWTQGETESNSRWFPTIDKPNERHTQDIRLTVEDHFVTLSNGLLVSSTPAGNGLRTDHWVMDLPHAPYLTMIAVGDWVVVQDEKWNGKEVSYYVESEYEEDAPYIFPYTPEMLSFFSDILGVPYPWQKYAQVVVRDFVSGAMENTTAVTFMEMVQAHREDLVDRQMNELITAHEMFHHWFGDLVTTESWANITLNEGFANYSEYLWLEYKHGRDEADAHAANELQGYLSSGNWHPLIYFGYENREDVFDAHSYNKGGLVLHMLRTLLGDEAFFTALHNYLTEHAYTDVEAHELRLAFEEVSGQDLNWFFDQWFFAAGHPILQIEKQADPERGEVKLVIEQIQEPTEEIPAIFRLPFEVDVYMPDGSKLRKHFEMNQRKQSFVVEVEAEPALVVFDAEHSLLAVVDYPKTEEEYAFQYLHAPTYFDRREALEALADAESTFADELFAKALDDPYWGFRQMAVEKCPDTEANMQRIAQLAMHDPHSAVRVEALLRLGETEDKAWLKVARAVVGKDPAASVRGAALELIGQLAPEEALEAAEKLRDTKSTQLILSLARVFAESGDPVYLDFFESKFDQMNNFDGIEFVNLYADLALAVDPESIQRVAERLERAALNPVYMPWYRFGAVHALNELHMGLIKTIVELGEDRSASLLELDEQIKAAIQRIKEAETNKRLKMMYRKYPSS